MCHKEKQRAPTGLKVAPTPTAALQEGLPALRAASGRAHPDHTHAPRRVKSQNFKHKSKDGKQQGPPHTPEMGLGKTRSSASQAGHSGTSEMNPWGSWGARVPQGGLLALPCSLEELVTQTLCSSELV